MSDHNVRRKPSFYDPMGEVIAFPLIVERFKTVFWERSNKNRAELPQLAISS
jgi:hypothetical protein